MLTSSTEIHGNFSITWDPKNGKFESSITYQTQLWSMCGCRTGKCVPRKEQVLWIRKHSQVILPKSLHKLRLQSAHRQTIDFGHNWRTTKTPSLFSYHNVCSNSTRQSMTFMEGQENSIQTHRLYTVHMIHVKNVNWILASKGTKIVPRISFKLSVDIGKNKIKLFTIIFITSA